MRKNSLCLWAMMAVAVLCLGFTSCGDDDDDDNTSSSTSKAMVGYWSVSPLSYSMVLFDDGVMKGMAHGNNSEITTGNWSYDAQTNTLATTALRNGYNLQWLITMLNTNNWTGVALWNDKNTTYMADNKENELDLNELNLLFDGKWVNDAGNTIVFSRFNIVNGRYLSFPFETDEQPQIPINIHYQQRWEYNLSFLLESTTLEKTKDQIKLSSYYYPDTSDFAKDYGFTIQITNPYSYTNRRLNLTMRHDSHRDGEVVTDFLFNCTNYHFQN